MLGATNDFVFLYSSNEIPSSGIRFTEIEVNPINFFSIGYDAIDEKIIFYTPCKKIYSPVIKKMVYCFIIVYRNLEIQVGLY